MSCHYLVFSMMQAIFLFSYLSKNKAQPYMIYNVNNLTDFLPLDIYLFGCISLAKLLLHKCAFLAPVQSLFNNRHAEAIL